MTEHNEDLNVQKLLEPGAEVAPDLASIASLYTPERDTNGVLLERAGHISFLRIIYDTQTGDIQKYKSGGPGGVTLPRGTFSMIYASIRNEGDTKRLELDNVIGEPVWDHRIIAPLMHGGYGGKKDVMGSKPGDYEVVEYVRKANIILAHQGLIDANPREAKLNEGE